MALARGVRNGNAKARLALLTMEAVQKSVEAPLALPTDVTQLSGTLSTEALYAGPGDSSTNYLFDDLFTDLISGTALTIKFTTDVQGDNVFTMSAICTSLDLNAGVEENTSYSASFEVTGAITKTVKA